MLCCRSETRGLAFVCLLVCVSVEVDIIREIDILRVVIVLIASRWWLRVAATAVPRSVRDLASERKALIDGVNCAS